MTVSNKLPLSLLLQLREELLSLNGIGPETADCLLVYAFDRCSFVIDTYTRRIFSRLGFDVPKKHDDFQNILELNIPKNQHCLRCLSRTYGTTCPGIVPDETFV